MESDGIQIPAPREQARPGLVRHSPAPQLLWALGSFSAPCPAPQALWDSEAPGCPEGPSQEAPPPPTCCDLEQVAVQAGTLSWAPGQARALQRSGRVTRVLGELLAWGRGQLMSHLRKVWGSGSHPRTVPPGHTDCPADCPAWGRGGCYWPLVGRDRDAAEHPTVPRRALQGGVRPRMPMGHGLGL